MDNFAQLNHVPVLLKETLELLDLKPGEICIDATLGGGGHTKAVSERVGNPGKILAIDADRSTVSRFQISDFRFQNVEIAQGNFRDIGSIAKNAGFEKVDAVLFDLGLSSMELDDPARGFAFQKDGPLDMRFDQRAGLSAARIVKEFSESELVKIFKEYGEERFAKRIARAAVFARTLAPITRTSQLFEIIKRALPAKLRHKAADNARRIFQALRIKVNEELESLTKALPQAYELLAKNGRLAVISFHSLEDRLVKRFFSDLSKGCVCPPEFPVCICGKSPQMRILTKKPIRASDEEIAANSRAKSAKLRAAIKN